MSLYWSRLACASCKAYGERGRACPEHALYGEGYEAGLEAAMRSLMVTSPLSANDKRHLIKCPSGMLGYDGAWGATGFDVAVFANEKKAKAAIATAPRWWPKQPWEVE